MTKTDLATTALPKNKMHNVLITQARPESEKSPYFDIARKYNLQLNFFSFIKLEPIGGRDFRKQKIEITAYTAVIFTSRNAIDHFFRMCDELKINVPQGNKYFCISEAVALYLQKFILYRKRKVFYSIDGANNGLFEVIARHKDNEKFLYVCSENQQDNEIVSWLKKNHCEFVLAFMYRSLSSDIKELFKKNKYDSICFFTPSGIKSLFESFPNFKQASTIIGTFGNNTTKAAIDAGLKPLILAPQPKAQSMSAAIELYFSNKAKKTK